MTLMEGSTQVGKGKLAPDGTASFSMSFMQPGSHTLTVIFANDNPNMNILGSTSQFVQTVLPWRVLPKNVYVTGADAGGGPDVRAFDAATNEQLDTFFPYNPLFTGGVRVAVGDVNGDGVPDIITAAGPGGGPDVGVFSGADGSTLFHFFAFNPLFTGGVFVASGDVNGDGFADIICGAAAGGGPNVTVFSGKDQAKTLLTSFFAYDSKFTGGVRVASADVNADGFFDLICGAGPGGGPNVTVFSGKDLGQTRFFSFLPTIRSSAAAFTWRAATSAATAAPDIMVARGAARLMSPSSTDSMPPTFRVFRLRFDFLGRRPDCALYGANSKANLVSVEGRKPTEQRPIGAARWCAIRSVHRR